MHLAIGLALFALFIVFIIYMGRMD